VTKNSNVQLTSNVYPVKVDGERIDFIENGDFVARVWDREALIKLFQCVHHVPPDTRTVEKYCKDIPSLSEWQIRRIKTPDECSLALPGEKPWGIVIYGESFEEVCKCNKRDCRQYAKCRPNMEMKDGVKK
jgi:hypothetical protein